VLGCSLSAEQKIFALSHKIYTATSKKMKIGDRMTRTYQKKKEKSPCNSPKI
jgi:hypothetical protein